MHISDIRYIVKIYTRHSANTNLHGSCTIKIGEKNKLTNKTFKDFSEDTERDQYYKMSQKTFLKIPQNSQKFLNMYMNFAKK